MTNSTNSVQSAYNQWATVYDSDNNFTRDLNAKVLRQQNFKLTDKSVLEIGCGTGLNTVWFADRAHNVEAVDISEAMLELAKRRVIKGRVQFHQADIIKGWDFKDGSFDLVVANLVLEHVENLSHIFQEAHRVLKSRGQLYIGELHPYRQLQGSKAQYKNLETGEKVFVLAFNHSVSEFINEGISAGFILQRIDEWKQPTDEMPRLLTLLFDRS